jgi:hypothetical protein
MDTAPSSPLLSATSPSSAQRNVVVLTSETDTHTDTDTDGMDEEDQYGDSIHLADKYQPFSTTPKQHTSYTPNTIGISLSLRPTHAQHVETQPIEHDLQRLRKEYRANLQQINSISKTSINLIIVDCPHQAICSKLHSLFHSSIAASKLNTREARTTSKNLAVEISTNIFYLLQDYYSGIDANIPHPDRSLLQSLQSHVPPSTWKKARKHCNLTYVKANTIDPSLWGIAFTYNYFNPTTASSALDFFTTLTPNIYTTRPRWSIHADTVAYTSTEYIRAYEITFSKPLPPPAKSNESALKKLFGTAGFKGAVGLKKQGNVTMGTYAVCHKSTHFPLLLRLAMEGHRELKLPPFKLMELKSRFQTENKVHHDPRRITSPSAPREVIDLRDNERHSIRILSQTTPSTHSPTPRSQQPHHTAGQSQQLPTPIGHKVPMPIKPQTPLTSPPTAGQRQRQQRVLTVERAPPPPTTPLPSTSTPTTHHNTMDTDYSQLQAALLAYAIQLIKSIPSTKPLPPMPPLPTALTAYFAAAPQLTMPTPTGDAAEDLQIPEPTPTPAPPTTRSSAKNQSLHAQHDPSHPSPPSHIPTSSQQPTSNASQPKGKQKRNRRARTSTLPHPVAFDTEEPNTTIPTPAAEIADDPLTFPPIYIPNPVSALTKIDHLRSYLAAFPMELVTALDHQHRLERQAEKMKEDLCVFPNNISSVQREKEEQSLYTAPSNLIPGTFGVRVRSNTAKNVILAHDMGYFVSTTHKDQPTICADTQVAISGHMIVTDEHTHRTCNVHTFAGNPSSFASIINHAPTAKPKEHNVAKLPRANCIVVHNPAAPRNVRPIPTKMMYVVAARPLLANEELFLDYGDAYWKNFTARCYYCFETATSPEDPDNPMLRCKQTYRGTSPDHSTRCCTYLHRKCARLEGTDFESADLLCPTCIKRILANTVDPSLPTTTVRSNGTSTLYRANARIALHTSNAYTLNGISPNSSTE